MTDHLHSFTLADMVREQARTLPATPALVDGGTTLTFTQVDAVTERWASRLAEQGVRRGHRVAWHGPDDHRLILLMFAAAKLGAHTVPLNWRCTDDELRGMLDVAEPTLVVTAPNPRAATRNWPDLAANSRVVDLLDKDDDAPARDDVSGNAPAYGALTDGVPPLAEDDDAPVLGFFTAAWTGTPKLALISHRAIVTQSLVLGAYRQVDVHGEVYLAAGPMFHVGALLKLFANYLFGNRVVFAPGGGAAEIAGLIESESVTSAYVFTPTIDQIAAANQAGQWDLSSLTVTPGAPSAEHAERWYAMTSCDRATAGDRVGYGQTETWAMASYTARGPHTTAPFGRPSPVACVHIDDDGRPAEPDAAGEILLRGPQIMAGYAGEPATGPWHHTGDLGVRGADGGLSFLGPLQAMIKTGMENVYPAEVEAVLVRLDTVADAAVVAVPDARWGEVGAAYVQLREGADVTDEDLRGHLEAHLARYKIPKYFTRTAALPRNATGKVRRVELRSRAAADLAADGP